MRTGWIIGWLALCLATGAGAAERPPSVTSYRHMTQQLQADARRSPLVRLVSLGSSAQYHRGIWLVRISNPKADVERTVRLFVLCRQHGDEPASTEAVLKIVNNVARGGDAPLRAALAGVTLYLVPMVNPDGADAMTRQNGVGMDLNRDWGIFSQPETRAVSHAVNLIRPQIIIDAHNWDSSDPYNTNCIEVARSSSTVQEQAAHQMQQRWGADLTQVGYQVKLTAYSSDRDMSLAHRYFNRQGLLAFLLETHSGDPRDLADFERRQGLYSALIHKIMRQFGLGDGTARTALCRLQAPQGAQSHETAFFSHPATPTRKAWARKGPRSYAWLWALLVYGGALGASALCRKPLAIILGSESGRRPTPALVPASGRPSASRRDTPQYRC